MGWHWGPAVLCAFIDRSAQVGAEEHSRPVFSLLCWWNLAERSGSTLVWLSHLSVPLSASLLVSMRDSSANTWSSICCHCNHLLPSVMEKRRDLNVRSFYLLCSVNLFIYIMLMTLYLSQSCHSVKICWDDLSSGGTAQRSCDLKSGAEVREDA